MIEKCNPQTRKFKYFFSHDFGEKIIKIDFINIFTPRPKRTRTEPQLFQHFQSTSKNRQLKIIVRYVNH